jgi:hypothetical protein
MKVGTARILGFCFGLVFAGTFASQFEILGLFVGLVTVAEIFRSKGQLVKGPWFGFIFGILAGYFLNDFISKYLIFHT